MLFCFYRYYYACCFIDNVCIFLWAFYKKWRNITDIRKLIGGGGGEGDVYDTVSLRFLYLENDKSVYEPQVSVNFPGYTVNVVYLACTIFGKN